MRIFTDKIEGDEYVFGGDSHRHIAYALRCRTGDRITLCPQDGYDYDGVIEKIEKDRTTVGIVGKTPSLGEASVETDVYFGVPHKSDKLDLIVQKLTELGVSHIRPIMTRFVQASEKSVRTDRLERIAEEAAKQSGRGRIPSVESPVGFDEMCKNLDGYDLVFFPYEGEKNYSAKSFFYENTEKKEMRRAAVIVGSEGGFAPEEAAALEKLGVRGVTLGKRILRAETACIAATAILMYELDEMS